MDQNESRSRQMRARESSRVGRLRFRSRTKAITVAAVVVVLAMSVIWPTVAAAVQNSHQFNQSWMILGPYYRKNTGGAPGADSLRLDYLTSRTVTQNSLLPITGSVIYTDCASPYCGSYSFVWNTLAHGYSVPTIFQYTDPDDTINLRGETAGNPDTGVFNQGNDLLGQGDNRLDNTMVYAWAYLNNKTGATTTTYLGVGSNDSIVVNVNGVERLLSTATATGALPMKCRRWEGLSRCERATIWSWSRFSMDRALLDSAAASRAPTRRASTRRSRSRRAK